MVPRNLLDLLSLKSAGLDVGRADVFWTKSDSDDASGDAAQSGPALHHFKRPGNDQRLRGFQHALDDPLE